MKIMKKFLSKLHFTDHQMRHFGTALMSASSTGSVISFANNYKIWGAVLIAMAVIGGFIKSIYSVDDDAPKP